MIGRFAAFAIFIVGFALIAVPREGTWESESGDGVFHVAPTSPGSRESGQDVIASWYGGDETLSRQSDGHFYASATINGTSARMLVDTGASVVALTGDDALAAGIDWDDSAVRPVARGASGTVYGVPIRLREVSVGSLTQRDIQAIIVPDGLDVSLLGQSFLSRLDSVEIGGETMTLNGG